MIPELHIEDYNYHLPEERIAKYPLEERDSSKLLVYKDGKCDDYSFRQLPEYLLDNSIMVFNDTKVVPARLFFRRSTGAHIEVFCLKPVAPVEYNLAFSSTESCTWKCVIGNSKRWKGDIVFFDAPLDSNAAALNLRARLVSKDDQTGDVEFFWDGGQPFSNVLDICGQVPIPPYLNRNTEDIDKDRYQTVYAHLRGSVAAPTAGLHFTERVLESIRARGIDTQTVCLHVGAGTFLPVKTSLVSEHPMHREPFTISRKLIEELVEAKRPVIAVGTTSVRTLESLYYAGVYLIENGVPQDVAQWDPYTRDYPYSTAESLQAIIKWLDSNGLDEFTIGTRIIIVPGFNFRIVKQIVTNFHQPQSTLLLLISAFVKGDWQNIYNHALSGDYRFLSYGDSSLLTMIR